MKLKVAVYIFAGCIGASCTLLADTITANSGAVFTSFNSSVFNPLQSSPAMNSQGTTFWNNWSSDTSADLGCTSNCTHNMNVGYMLTDTGGYSGTPSVLGNAGEAAANALIGCTGSYSASNPCLNNDPTSWAVNVTGNSYNLGLIGAYSGNNGTDGTVFGWYQIVDGSPVLHQLYNSVGYVTSAEALNPFSTGLPIGGQFGFYATVCYNMVGAQNGTDPNCSGTTETFFSDSLLDNGILTNLGPSSGFENYNHFALFNLTSASDDYVIAFKDGVGPNGAEGMGDFNDLVFEFVDPSTLPGATPEPATLGVVAFGLVALAAARRGTR